MNGAVPEAFPRKSLKRARRVGTGGEPPGDIYVVLFLRDNILVGSAGWIKAE
jgi:hypothetical protein